MMTADDMASRCDDIGLFDAMDGGAGAGISLFAIIADGNDFAAVSGSTDRTGFRTAVSGRNHDDKTGIPKFLYFPHERRGFIKLLFFGSAGGNIYDVDALAHSVSENPVDAGADIFDGSFSVAVQHFDCDEICPGSDTAVQSPACLAASGSNPGDVGSVAVVIVRLAGGRKDVMPSDDAPDKVRMWGDSAVEYGDAAPCPIDMRPMCIRGFDDFTDTIHTKSRLLPFCFSIWKGQERCDCCLHRVKDVL